MVILELREATYEKIFDLIDQLEELGDEKEKLMSMLKKALYECHEASKKEGEEYEDDKDMEFRSNYRSNMRSGMRHYDEDKDDDIQMYGYRKSRGMRMRSNRMGRYSY